MDLQKIQREKDINGFKIYRPKVQIYVDYIAMVPLLACLLASIGVIDVPAKTLVTFRQFVNPKMGFILVMYCFKPFIITLLSKCSGFTN
jgi:hypothetical protein